MKERRSDLLEARSDENAGSPPKGPKLAERKRRRRRHGAAERRCREEKKREAAEGTINL